MLRGNRAAQADKLRLRSWQLTSFNPVEVALVSHVHLLHGHQHTFPAGAIGSGKYDLPERSSSETMMMHVDSFVTPAFYCPRRWARRK
jgi:hypothetical protein